jgi:hypothetical protein
MKLCLIASTLFLISCYSFGAAIKPMNCNVAIEFEGVKKSKFPYAWNWSKSNKIRFKASVLSEKVTSIKSCTLELQTNINDKVIVKEYFSCGGESENSQRFSSGYKSNLKDVPSFGGRIYCLNSSENIDTAEEIISMQHKKSKELLKDLDPKTQIIRTLTHDISSKELSISKKVNYLNIEEVIKDKFEKRFINDSGFVYSPGEIESYTNGRYSFHTFANMTYTLLFGEKRNQYGLNHERDVKCELGNPSYIESEFFFPSIDKSKEVLIKSSFLCRVDLAKLK